MVNKYGTTGNDSIEGSTGDDFLSGGEGRDTIRAYAGNDTVFLWDQAGTATGAIASGNVANNRDLVYLGGGDDLIRTGLGQNTIDGGTGNDTLNLVDSGSTNSTINMNVGGTSGTYTMGGYTSSFSNFETFIGGNGDDTLSFTGTEDRTVSGLGGDDRITTAGGNDTIDGGSGSDTINSGAGDDYISQTTSSTTPYDNQADSINAGSGNDTIKSSFGNDTINGGTGTDLYDSSSFGQNTSINLNTGTGSYAGTTTTGLSLSSIENVYTGRGADSVRGSGEDNLIKTNAGNDTIQGAGGNDTIEAGAGDDSINGGGDGGADSILAGDGNDYVRANAGTGSNDTVYGGAGDDTIESGIAGGNQFFYGEEGNDSISGENLSQYIDGGIGNDTLRGGADANTGDTDTLIGGDGDDSIISGFTGSTTITQGDSMVGGAGMDTIIGGTAYDTISGGADNDSLSGGGGDDSITGDAGNDTIYADDGNDYLDGGIDDDRLYGNAGDDTMLGGSGDDYLRGGDGNDSLTGGSGDDHFRIYETSGVGSGHDTITDFGEGTTGPIDDNNFFNNDYVNLAGFYNQANYDAAVAAGDIDSSVIKNPLQWMRADQADDGVLNDTNAGWDANNSLTIQNGGAAAPASGLTYDTTNVLCFAKGTLIKTIQGDVPVEELSQGDMVLTRDHGFQPLRWIGSNPVSQAVLAAHENLYPVRIRAGALGSGLPEQDLVVSPQHRILVSSKIVKRMFEGEDEVLVAAKQLVMIDGIDIAYDIESVEYFHFLFEQHEIVFSNGAETESLYTGPEALKTVNEESRAEILTLFPEIASIEYTPASCRTIVKGRKGRQLAVRHKNNNKPLLALS